MLSGGPGFHDFTIDQVMPKSPAERKGVRPGDRIQSVNRVSTSQLTVDDLDRLFRHAGSLHLKFNRDDKQIKVTLKLKPMI